MPRNRDNFTKTFGMSKSSMKAKARGFLRIAQLFEKTGNHERRLSYAYNAETFAIYAKDKATEEEARKLVDGK